jgi:hypothetical protein
MGEEFEKLKKLNREINGTRQSESARREEHS